MVREADAQMLTLDGLLGGLEAQANVLVPPQAVLAGNPLHGLPEPVGSRGAGGLRTTPRKNMGQANMCQTSHFHDLFLAPP